MIAFIYLIAMLFGIILVAYDLITGKSKWQGKNLLGGIALGVINFFSTYCVFHAMRYFDNVVLFPIYIQHRGGLSHRPDRLAAFQREIDVEELSGTRHRHHRCGADHGETVR